MAEVILTPEAQEDLLRLYLYLAEQTGSDLALKYVQRLEAYCQRLETFPERGVRRDDLRPGMRLIGFERRVSILFHVEDKTTAYIDRILYGGRDLDAALNEP